MSPNCAFWQIPVHSWYIDSFCASLHFSLALPEQGMLQLPIALWLGIAAVGSELAQKHWELCSKPAILYPLAIHMSKVSTAMVGLSAAS